MLWFAEPRASHASVAERARHIGERHDILVSFGSPDTFFVAPFGPDDARIAGYEFGQAAPEGLPDSLDGIERALDQYPRGFVAKLIRAVFVCGELRVDGARAGGTVGRAWIIVASKPRLGREGRYLTAYLGVHHELSSFVYRHDPSTEALWREFAPRDWQFIDRAPDVLARGEDRDPSPTTGFLTAYGATNPENDFNTYAEQVFSESAELRLRAKDQPLIARKLAFVLDAYRAVDPRIDDVFRKLGFD